jgi:glycosyltransferase involved in cell wall biosynthesis
MVTLALQLTGALLRASRGHDFVLFCSRERPAGLPVDGTTAVLSPHRDEVINKLLWFPAVEAQSGLDAIFYPYWPPPPRRKLSAPPSAMFVHDLAFRLRPSEVPWQQRAYLGSVLPRALEGAAVVIAPSDSTRLDLLGNYPVPGLAARTHVVAEAAANLGTEADSLPDGVDPGFILAVGTIEPRKNYGRLVAAYRLLKERRPAAPQLVVVGRVGWAYGNALQLLQSEPGVRLLGHVPDASLRRLYQEASLLVFPSVYEGFGLPLLEAMAEGLPAMIGTAGALPELAAGAALEVDVMEPRAIADGMARLLGDAGLRLRLAESGRRRAQAFSWDRAASETMSLLELIAEGGDQLSRPAPSPRD